MIAKSLSLDSFQEPYPNLSIQSDLDLKCKGIIKKMSDPVQFKHEIKAKLNT